MTTELASGRTPRMLSDPIGRVRVIGMVEAVSFIVLLGVAMPLKYAFGMPLAVRIVGMSHGVLFIGLCWAAVTAAGDVGWSWRRIAGVIGAALVPFGPFVIDRGLAREQRARAAADT